MRARAFFYSPNLLIIIAGLLTIVAGFGFFDKSDMAYSVLLSIGAALLATGVAAAVAFAWVGTELAMAGLKKVWPNRSSIPKEDWDATVGRAHHRCTLLGVAMGGYCNDATFREVVRSRVEAGVLFELFFLDPDSNAAHTRDDEEKRGTIQQIRRSIQSFGEFKMKFSVEQRDNFRLYIYSDTPTFSVTSIDNYMIASHYLARFENYDAVAFECAPPRGIRRTFQPDAKSIFNVYQDNVRRIREATTTIELVSEEELKGRHHRERTRDLAPYLTPGVDDNV